MDKLIAISILILISAVAVSAQPLYITCAAYGLYPSNFTHVIIWLQLNNVTTPNGLYYLLQQQYYNPQSPYFHKFITPQQFSEWYSPPQYVFTYIENVLQSNGLSILGTYPMAIVASGNASAVDGALSALSSAPQQISQWIIAGECVPIGYFSKGLRYRPEYIYVPMDSAVRAALNAKNFTYLGGVPAQLRIRNFEIWLPKGLQYIYDEMPLLSQGINGGGVKIGIVDAFGDVNFTLAEQGVYQNTAGNDLDLFDKVFGLPPANLTVIYPVGVPTITPFNYGDALGWSYETALDLEYAHTMAPGASLVLAVSPDAGDDLFIAVEYLINNSMVDFISLSWGLPEDVVLAPPPTPQLLRAYDEIFMQAAAEGIGVFAASGDWGAFDIFWQYFGLPIEPSVIYPASDPWVTAVGGTSLQAYMANGNIVRVESAWNWNAYYMWGSGGGYSFFFNETPGQLIARIAYERPVIYEPTLSELYGYKYFFYTVGHRGVPDVAADADPFTGVLIVVNGSLSGYIFGGTSLATPLTAGMTATVQSGLSTRIGYLAPTLYLMYSKYGEGVYQWNTSISAWSLFQGLGGALFPTFGGENGLYNVIVGSWNPVDGLGQLNVYGLYSALR